MSSDFLSDSRSVLSRRRFVQGLALGGVVAGAGMARIPQAFASGRAMAVPPVELRGTELNLAIGRSAVNFTGRTRPAKARPSTCSCATRWNATRPPSTGTASCCRPTWTACRG